MQKHLVKAGITGWAQVNDLRGDTDLARADPVRPLLHRPLVGVVRPAHHRADAVAHPDEPQRLLTDAHARPLRSLPTRTVAYPRPMIEPDGSPVLQSRGAAVADAAPRAPARRARADLRGGSLPCSPSRCALRPRLRRAGRSRSWFPGAADGRGRARNSRSPRHRHARRRRAGRHRRRCVGHRARLARARTSARRLRRDRVDRGRRSRRRRRAHAVAQRLPAEQAQCRRPSASRRRLLPVILARNPAWLGRINGVALAVRGPLPSRCASAASPPSRWAHARSPAIASRSGSRSRDGPARRSTRDRRRRPPGPAAAAARRARRRPRGCVLLALRSLACRRSAALASPLHARRRCSRSRGSRSTRAGRQPRAAGSVTARTYAGKDSHDKHLAAEDGPLFAFVEKARARHAGDAGTRIRDADAHYFRGRAAYHLLSAQRVVRTVSAT